MADTRSATWGGILIRFAGFELDDERAELRRADGTATKLRPKAFEMLRLFAANSGRVIGKQELMEAVWPNVHVGEDSLFQCIRELRGALGDEQRQMIRLVSGQGYVFDVDVSAAAIAEPEVGAEPPAAVARARRPTSRWLRPAVGIAAAIAVALALLVAVPIIARPRSAPHAPTIVAVMPLTGVGADEQIAETAASVTTRLADGLAKIDNIRVATTPDGAAAPSTERAADYLVRGELRRIGQAWTVEARLVDTATQQVQLATSVSVDIGDTDPQTQQSRLAAGIGHELAVRLNALLNPDADGDAGADGSSARVAIEQANASIVQTSRERFADAQKMLEHAIAADPDNTQLAVALAALQLRGIQMVWYDAAGSTAAAASAKSTLEHALRLEPSNVAVLEAYCRFLNATTDFTDSLVICGRALSYDPWNGIALYHIGLAQMQLGRFDDALATFQQADQFDTPRVARWTWLVGAGWVSLVMDRNEAALGWLQRSVAITPASGRPLMLLAAALHRLGRQEEAQAALSKALALRPGTTALNVSPPTTGASPLYLAASARIIESMVGAGLPER